MWVVGGVGAVDSSARAPCQAGLATNAPHAGACGRKRKPLSLRTVLDEAVNINFVISQFLSTLFKRLSVTERDAQVEPFSCI